MRTPPLIALVAVMLVTMTGFGAFLPIFPFLAMETGAPASHITWAFGAYSFGQFVAAPLWGRLSDRIGRKPVLTISMIVSALAYVAMAHANTMWEIGGARLFSGLLAGGSTAAFAAAADLADDKTRARNMGLLGAAVGFGFIAGPAIGALLVSASPTHEDYARICYVSAGLTLAAAVMTLLLFSETRVRDPNATQARAKSFSLLASKPALALFVVTTLVFMAAQSLMEATFGLWANAAFDWGAREVGWTLAGMGVGAALLQGGAAGAAARRWGERSTLRGGLAVFCWGMLFLAAARIPGAAYVALAMITLGIALAQPALQSLVASVVDEHERGAAMGLNQSAGALGRVIGPLLSGPLFDALGHSAPYALAAALLGVALLMGFAAPKPAPQS